MIFSLSLFSCEDLAVLVASMLITNNLLICMLLLMWVYEVY